MITRCLYLFLLLFLFATATFAQKVPPHFELTGSVNVDTGTAKLYAMGGGSYYPGNLQMLITPVKNGKFSFSGACLYPYQYRLIISSGTYNYLSDYFLVERGTQQVVCQIDASRKIPAISGHLTAERKNGILNMYEPLELQKDALGHQYNVLAAANKQVPKEFLDNYTHQKDSLNTKEGELLSGYIKAHPDSYVALWELVRLFEDSYQDVFPGMFSHFSKDVRNSYTGKVLDVKMTQARMVAIGAVFPALSLTDANKKPVKIKTNANKYTLVDFWFSHCSACISQFDELKELYAKYKGKGFTIAGVSTDAQPEVPAWKAAIIKYQLPWEQYLDLNGKNAIRLSITGYPTNFLLDSEGRIVQRNIDLEALNYFLHSKLN